MRRVDIDAIAQRIDLDAVADRIDIDRIVARIDIDAIVAGVDLNAIVDRLNVVGLAEEVINEIDLPEIIRDSTGSMASQVVRDARMQSIDADEAVSGWWTGCSDGAGSGLRVPGTTAGNDWLDL